MIQGLKFLHIPITPQMQRHRISESGYALVVISGVTNTIIHFQHDEQYPGEQSIPGDTDGIIWPVPFEEFWITSHEDAGLLTIAIITVPPTQQVIRAVYGLVRIVDDVTLHTQRMIAHGRDVVGTPGTPIPLNGGNALTCRGVLIRAEWNNTDRVFIGLNNVNVDNGMFLSPGDTIFLPTPAAHTIFINSATNGVAVRWIATA